MTKTRVLFMCTGNTARSQMAEAFLRACADDRFEVYSAGLEPREINSLTRVVMQERGLDLDGQYPKGLKEFLGRVHFGYLITVCDRAERECPTFPGMGIREFWPFEDPAAFEGTKEERIAKFREVRDAIEARVKEWVGERSPNA